MICTEPERCFDCGAVHPGGGFCPPCLYRRIHALSAALERAMTGPTQPADAQRVPEGD